MGLPCGLGSRGCWRAGAGSPPPALTCWPLFPCPTATSLPVLINPARPGQYRGVPEHSGFDFFWFFIDFAALRTLEIIEKPLENLGFCVIFASHLANLATLVHPE